MYYLNSPKITNYVAKITGGSASPHINVSDIKNFEIPFPSISIQNSIVDEIDSKLSICDSIEQSIEKSLQQSEALRQSILRESFVPKLSR